MHGKLESKFETLDARVDSLEKRFPVVEDLAEIKARLAQVEKTSASPCHPRCQVDTSFML